MSRLDRVLLTLTLVVLPSWPRFDARATLKVIELVKVTTFCAPPTAYRMIVQEDLRAYDLSSLRHCLSAGEPLNPQVIQVWYSLHPDTAQLFAKH